MDAFDNPASFDGDHLLEQRFDALGRAAAQVAFANLSAHQLARSSDPKTLRSSLMGLDLVFSIWLLAWHGRTPLITQNSAELANIRGGQTTQISENKTSAVSLLLLWRLPWSQDHQHRSPFERRRLLYDANIRERLCYLFQVRQSDIQIINLSAAEADAHLDFVSVH